MEFLPELEIERYAYSIFCDDIRTEDSGKQIFIGVYHDSLVVPSFPILLPSFCIYTSAHTRFERPFKMIATRIILNERVVIEDELPESVLESRPEIPDSHLADATLRFTVKRVMRLQPFILEGPGVLRVRVGTESETLRAGGLRIMQGQGTGKTNDSA